MSGPPTQCYNDYTAGMVWFTMTEGEKKWKEAPSCLFLSVQCYYLGVNCNASAINQKQCKAQKMAFVK